MNIYSLLPLSAFIASLAVALFVIRRDSKSQINRIYAVSSVFLALWSFFNFLRLNAAVVEAAQVFEKYESLTCIMFTAAIFHFFIVFAEAGPREKRFLAAAAYATGIAFSAIALFTNLIADHMVPTYWGYKLVPGYMWSPYMLAAFIFPTIGIFMCARLMRHTKDAKKKKQAVVIIVAILIPFFGAVLTDVVPPLFSFEVMSLSSTLSTGMSVLVAFAVSRYNLMSITPSLAAGSILKTLADYVLVFSSDGKVAFLSDSAAQMLGKGSDATGTRLDGLFPDGTLASVFGKLEKEGILKDMETIISPGAGKKIPVSLNCSMVKDVTGGTLGYVIVMKDMTRIRELIKSLEGRTAELEKSKGELEKSMVDSERLNRLAIGRELKMVELKKTIEQLESKRGKGK